MRTTKGGLAIDPRGLIFEAYRMELDLAECRAIFLDWAMDSAADAGPAEVALLLDHYGSANPHHPMTAVLRDGLAATAPPRRRGGRSAGRDDGA